jgi:hypothetical protein
MCVFCLFSGHPKIIIMPSRSEWHDDDFGVSITSVSFSTSTGCLHDGAAQIVASVALVCTVYTHPLHSYHSQTVARLDFGPSFIESAFNFLIFVFVLLLANNQPGIIFFVILAMLTSP